MKRSGASRGKLTGLYLRGKTFWFTYRLNGKKRFHSLGTADYGEAVQKALEIRQHPELASAAVFASEIEAFIAHKLARNEYSSRSAGVKVHALKQLAAATGRANLVQVTATDVTTFCLRERRGIRIPLPTATRSPSLGRHLPPAAEHGQGGACLSRWKTKLALPTPSCRPTSSK